MLEAALSDVAGHAQLAAVASIVLLVHRQSFGSMCKVSKDFAIDEIATCAAERPDFLIVYSTAALACCLQRLLWKDGDHRDKQPVEASLPMLLSLVLEHEKKLLAKVITLSRVAASSA